MSSPSIHLSKSPKSPSKYENEENLEVKEFTENTKEEDAVVEKPRGWFILKSSQASLTGTVWQLKIRF